MRNTIVESPGEVESDTLERFWSKVKTTEGINRCWPWLGCVNSRGYGSFKYRGRSEQSHRIAYALTRGGIPRGMVVCHSCDHPPCCNPHHLFLGSIGENVSDMIKKGRANFGGRDEAKAALNRKRLKRFEASGRPKAPQTVHELIVYYPDGIDARIRAKFWSKIDQLSDAEGKGCWLYTGAINRNGYGVFHHRGRFELAHRVAYALTSGPIAGGLLCCHHCDVRRCCNPDHLFLGSHADNSRDMAAKGRCRGGRAVKGEEHVNARLDDERVRVIRRRYESRHETGDSMTKIASEFGVSRRAVRFVVRRESWSHIQ